MSTPVFQRTIVLRGEYCIYEDVTNNSTIKPGMLLQRRDRGNGLPVVIPHGLAGGRGACLIATENPLNAGGTVDTTYAAEDVVRYHHAKPGDIVNVLLAAGQNAKIGSELISAGNGKFTVSADVDTNITLQSAFGTADTALNLTASGAVDTLIPMRVGGTA